MTCPHCGQPLPPSGLPACAACGWTPTVAAAFPLARPALADPARWATPAMLAVGVASLLAFAYAFVPLVGIWAVDTATRTGGRAPAVLFTLADVGTLTALLLAAATALGCFAGWQYRCSTNLRSMGVRTSYPPALAVAGWFIPVVSAVLPGLVTAELAGCSAPADRPDLGGQARRLAWAWWAGSVTAMVGWVISVLASRPDELSTIRTNLANGDAVDTGAAHRLFAQQTAGRLIGAVLVLGAAVLVLVLIERVTALQYDRFEAAASGVPIAGLPGASPSGPPAVAIPVQAVAPRDAAAPATVPNASEGATIGA
jgi:hypothetical protein